MGKVLGELDRGFGLNSDSSDPLPNWGEWLDKPFTLPKLLEKHKKLLLPLDDPRVQCFVSRILSDVEEG